MSLVRAPTVNDFPTFLLVRCQKSLNGRPLSCLAERASSAASVRATRRMAADWSGRKGRLLLERFDPPTPTAHVLQLPVGKVLSDVYEMNVHPARLLAETCGTRKFGSGNDPAVGIEECLKKRLFSFAKTFVVFHD